MPNADGKPIVFVSHSSNDKPWAEWVAWILEEEGCEAIFDAWDFRPGTNFVQKMNDALQRSDFTLCLFSPNFFNGPFAQSELFAAFASDPTGTERKLIPARIADFKPEGLFNSLVYIDLVGVSEDEARQELMAGIAPKRPKPTTKPGFPGSGASPSAPTASKPAFPGIKEENAVSNVPLERVALNNALTAAQPGNVKQLVAVLSISDHISDTLSHTDRVAALMAWAKNDANFAQLRDTWKALGGTFP